MPEAGLGGPVAWSDPARGLLCSLALIPMGCLVQTSQALGSSPGCPPRGAIVTFLLDIRCAAKQLVGGPELPPSGEGLPQGKGWAAGPPSTQHSPLLVRGVAGSQAPPGGDRRPAGPLLSRPDPELPSWEDLQASCLGAQRVRGGGGGRRLVLAESWGGPGLLEGGQLVLASGSEAGDSLGPQRVRSSHAQRCGLRGLPDLQRGEEAPGGGEGCSARGTDWRRGGATARLSALLLLPSPSLLPPPLQLGLAKGGTSPAAAAATEPGWERRERPAALGGSISDRTGSWTQHHAGAPGAPRRRPPSVSPARQPRREAPSR